MLTQILWWSGNALTSLLLIRSVAGKYFTKYPCFYFYQAFFLVRSLLAFYLYVAHPESFQRFYWHSEFVSVAVEYVILWEIYVQILAGYPGAARMARRLLSLIFVVVVATVLAKAVRGPILSLAQTTAELEGYLRSVQAILLLAILGVLAYYTIPVGRNLRGIILGYGLFIGTRVIGLALRIHIGDEFQLWWQYVHQLSDFVSFAIWCIGLWSYSPQPQPEGAMRLERDYELLSAQVARGLSLTRNHLVRVFRP